MSGTGYFRRDGQRIKPGEWIRLRADPSYALVRQYDNGRVRVQVEWLGSVPDPGNLFRDCWPMFKLHVFNCNEQGAFVADPVENGRTFAFEEEAVAAYELFLEHWTNSYHKADGSFVEKDNDLAPPPPPDPDAPTTDASKVASVSLGDDDVGVW